jgi:hypothetical protein
MTGQGAGRRPGVARRQPKQPEMRGAIPNTHPFEFGGKFCAQRGFNMVVAHKQIQSGQQALDPMHEQHRMHARFPANHVPRRRGRAG